MIIFLLNVYLLCVWLVFIKFKLLAFDLKAKIAIVIVGFVGIFGLLIAVNFIHPQSMDAIVTKPILEIASRTSQPARVLEVNVEPNKPVKKGDVLFVLDARIAKAEVERLKAAVAEAEQNVPQMKAAYDAELANVEKTKGQLALAEVDERRNKEALPSGTVSQEDYDTAVRNLTIAQNALLESNARAEKARLAYESKTASGENVQVAQLKAQLIKAEIDVEESTVYAPADGYVTNLQLRPGFVVGPGSPVMSFVSNEAGSVVITMPQEYLQNIELDNEVEVCLDMYPGKTLHGTVESIILASGAGQLDPSGLLPTASSRQAAARFPIKVKLDAADAAKYPLVPGAHGAAAIYTNHVSSFKIIRRVTLRWYTWLNYFKLAM
jgi:multidrug resistance efflux pump